MEFHESGYVHVHLLFYGSWVAKFEEIHELWGVCDYNGVRFAKRRFTDGPGICRYLTRYLSKDLQSLGNEKGSERLAALMWYFRRRLYNFRHYAIGLDGQRVWGIPGEQFKRPVKWRLYRAEAGEVELTDGRVVWYKPPGKRIGKQIDDYLVAIDAAAMDIQSKG